MANAVTARGGAVDLVIDDRAALLATTPAPTCQVNITDVHAEFDTSAAGGVIRQVNATGLAWGSGKVTVTLSLAGGSGPYVWAVPDGDLLGKLRELAAKRDADDEFWSRFAGLEKAPADPKDFDGLADAEDWRRWWNRRSEPCGIPLLPVWAPEEARRTSPATRCWEPSGDFPDAFKPGGEAQT